MIQLEQERRLLLDQVLHVLQPLIETFAKERGLDLVLTAPSPALAYFAASLDVTDELIARLDRVRVAGGAQAEPVGE